MSVPITPTELDSRLAAALAARAARRAARAEQRALLGKRRRAGHDRRHYQRLAEPFEDPPAPAAR
jgi:hypothetical protein